MGQEVGEIVVRQRVTSTSAPGDSRCRPAAAGRYESKSVQFFFFFRCLSSQVTMGMTGAAGHKVAGCLLFIQMVAHETEAFGFVSLEYLVVHRPSNNSMCIFVS